MGCGQPIVTMQMFSNSATGRSGRRWGCAWRSNHLTRVVGPVVFGVIGSAFGLPAVFWINGLMLGGGGALSRVRDFCWHRGTKIASNMHAQLEDESCSNISDADGWLRPFRKSH